MSEQKGRCYNEMKVSRDFPTDHFVMADAIDRLAADVAAVKEAVCDGSVAEERDRFFAGWAAALNERDKLRAEVERLKAIVHSDAGHMAKILIENERLRAELAARQADGNRQATLDSSPAVTEPAQDASEEIAELKFWVEKYRVKAEAYGGMVRGCAPALERAGHPVNGRGPDGAVGGIARAVEALIRERDAAIRERDAALADAARLNAELAAQAPGGNSSGIPYSSPPAPQPAAPPQGWLTEEERELLSLLKDTADSCSMVHSPWRCNWPYSRMSLVVTAILARAGSPPVVEVPTLRQPGPMTIREKQIHVAYLAAMDKAGVAWKEVGA